MNQVECLRSQNDELKALSYIYLDEFRVLKESAPYKFIILCRPYKGNQFQYQINLQFEFTKSYPKTPLKYEIEPVTGITRDNLNEIGRKIEGLLYQNRNKPVVYDIVEEARGWIHEYLVDGRAYSLEDEKATKKDDTVYERPKFVSFTPVTIETFQAWKKQFQAKHKVAKVVEKVVDKKNPVKVSGKEWFVGKTDLDEESDEEDSEDLDLGDEEEPEEEEQQINPNLIEEPKNSLFEG